MTVPISYLGNQFAEGENIRLSYRTPSYQLIKTAEWSLTEPGTSNSFVLIINTHQDGSISCEGSWNYSYAGRDIVCEELRGAVRKDTTYHAVFSYGTARCQSNQCETGSSNFDLTIRGDFKNGNASGTWEISFDEPSWSDYATRGRKFTGMLQYEKASSQNE